jgi:hypothetical protein
MIRTSRQPQLATADFAPGTPEHAEWLLDEAVAESFPASDPPATSYPGSTLARMLAAEPRQPRFSATGALVLTAGLLLVGFLVARGGRRSRTA